MCEQTGLDEALFYKVSSEKLRVHAFVANVAPFFSVLLPCLIYLLVPGPSLGQIGTKTNQEAWIHEATPWD